MTTLIDPKICIHEVYSCLPKWVESSKVTPVNYHILSLHLDVPFLPALFKQMLSVHEFCSGKANSLGWCLHALAPDSMTADAHYYIGLIYNPNLEHKGECIFPRL